MHVQRNVRVITRDKALRISKAPFQAVLWSTSSPMRVLCSVCMQSSLTENIPHIAALTDPQHYHHCYLCRSPPTASANSQQTFQPTFTADNTWPGSPWKHLCMHLSISGALWNVGVHYIKVLKETRGMRSANALLKSYGSSLGRLFVCINNQARKWKTSQD